MRLVFQESYVKKMIDEVNKQIKDKEIECE